MTSELDLSDPTQVSSVLQSVGGSLAILESSLQHLAADAALDETAEKRIAALSKAIGECAVEALNLAAVGALNFAQEVDPEVGPWLWDWGAAADRREPVTAGADD
jgi:hypothetical protein